MTTSHSERTFDFYNLSRNDTKVDEIIGDRVRSQGGIGLRTSWYDAFRTVPLWGNASVVLTLAVATAVTYRTGGTTNAFPHLYYVPVVIAAFLYGVPGGTMSGVVAGVLCGPWMPHHVELGIAQTLDNWTVRMLFFVAIGALTGGLTGSLRQRIIALGELNEQTILAFVQAIDAKDPYTAQHSTRVAFFAQAIAKELGLPVDHVECIRRAALLHDVGKIAVPGRILNKPGPLTPEEYRLIQQHPVESVKIISGIDQYRKYISGVRHHHERLDGKGYPDGLSGSAVPLDARIIAVADAFEAMTSHRAYRSKLPTEEALRRMREGAGTQFDPIVVEALGRVVAGAGKPV